MSSVKPVETKRNVALTGAQKAAALLIALGPDAASEILRHCEDEEIEIVTYEISSMGRVPGGLKQDVLEECYHMSFVSEGVAAGGLEYAREMLSRAVGNKKAQEFIERVRVRTQGAPFDFLNEADPAQLANSLRMNTPRPLL